MRWFALANASAPGRGIHASRMQSSLGLGPPRLRYRHVDVAKGIEGFTVHRSPNSKPGEGRAVTTLDFERLSTAVGWAGAGVSADP
jgi:hypothetical protein